MMQRRLPLRLLLACLGASIANGTPLPHYAYHSRVVLATIPNYNRTAGSKRPSKPADKQPKCVNGVCEYNPRTTRDGKDVRGGAFMYPTGDYDHYDEYDEYDDYEEEKVSRPRRPLPSQRRPPPRDAAQRRLPPRSAPRRRYRKSAGALDTAAGLAKKTVGITTTAAVSSLKTSGKAAFYLVSPKHVQRNEVWGVWRLDQQVGKLPDGPFVSCAANVELTPRGDCITKYKEEVYHTPYSFKEKSWPKSCYVEFEARAFQGPKDETPVLMLYKGYFRRKMADRNVIKIVGKIYELRKQRFGRGTKRVQVGTFVARRRITAPPGGVRLQERRERSRNSKRSEEEEEYDDDGYDEYDEEQYDEYDEYDQDEEGEYE